MNDKNDTGMDENGDLTKPKYRSSLSGRDLRASSIGWEISLPIVAGPLVGYLIDKRFDTGVTFTLIFLGLGLAIGVWNLVRFIAYEFSLIRSKEQDSEHNSGNDINAN